ncbi:MAG TPA: V-type ATP synthase subunit D [Desulfomonilia bacterium]|nr:V-type ATP synthase subunit D [Desulfomonilia bacterium]
MAVKIHVTRPTKIELARLKKRLRLAKRIQKIIKDRLSILVMEFLQTVRESAEVRERLQKEYEEAYKALSLSVGYHGYAQVEQSLMVSSMPFSLHASTRNVAGVTLPTFQMEQDRDSSSWFSPAEDSSLIEYASSAAQRCLSGTVELAELQSALELLGDEINKVKRVNNALEYAVIPGLDATIKYLSMKFEERDREEVARLKYVKLLIEKREAYAY